MSRKNESNQKAALRSAFGQFLRENDVTIKNSDDVNSIMKDMISLVLEGALDGEMDEHLGYSKYDYEGKNTGNSRNGYSKKTVHTSYGENQTLILMQKIVKVVLRDYIKCFLEHGRVVPQRKNIVMIQMENIVKTLI